MTADEIQKQIEATAQDPFKSVMVVYGCRAFALFTLAVLFIVHAISGNSLINGIALFVFSVSFFVAGYLDARQYYKGQLWIASQNLERMTVDLLALLKSERDSSH